MGRMGNVDDDGPRAMRVTVGWTRGR